MKKLLLIGLIAMLGISTAEAKKKQIKTQKIRQAVTVTSLPDGASVYVDGKQVLARTPGAVDIEFQGFITPDKKNMDAAYKEAKRLSSVTLTVVKDGYIQKDVVLEPSISMQKVLAKSIYIFDWPKIVNVDLEPARGGAYDKDTSMRAGEAGNVVNRDRPGQTALERTIIRWYFESAPQGARIFWRVISSVPDQVKNTNENWLGNTPFEETRSFNIQGLTYENSRDVQIEIKVRRPGYLDQTKRFNVRQAIDQQEISSFFDMIKAD